MILNEQQIESMKTGGKILASIIRQLIGDVKPGVTTKSLAQKARDLLSAHTDVEPSFLGVNGYTDNICLSVNDEAVHALPSDRVLQEGDLLKIDFGLKYQGLHVDSAVTVLVSSSGSVRNAFKSEYAQRRKLIQATRDALVAGIKAARAGNTIQDIGRAVSDVVVGNGFTVVKELGGHGIGHNLHEDPFIPNYPDGDFKHPLEPGMAIAIEPITAIGDWRIKESSDGFGFCMKDGSLSAHFEHTIIITDKAPIVVTQ